ncbi:MAG: hypothetical protein CVV41_14490 [Candidatus Riflebacteria bacterium HGW-Riflebacteria-1]|nr:MAG: hypothetical protein CVV41_14490 [Candidatus Riflebacteria bacterium HGW-Riflebacteria-1]
MMQNCFYKNVNKGVGRFFAHEVLMPGGSGWRSPGPMRESFFAPRQKRYAQVEFIYSIVTKD